MHHQAQKKLHDKYVICPIGSTIITLTSKLLWVLGHHHDYNFGSKMMSYLPTNAVRVMDRDFAGLKFIQELVQENKYFLANTKQLETRV